MKAIKETNLYQCVCLCCQELLASLPQKVNEDWDLGLENHSKSGVERPNIQKESSVSEEEGDTDQMRL